MKDPGRLILKRCTRALMEYRLVSTGDRVLVALSGGKDSLALAWALSRLSRGFPQDFSVEAFHLDTGFQDRDLVSRLADFCAMWDIPLEILRHPAADRAQSGAVPSCFRCSRDRRRSLLEKAYRDGFAKVALGHHMDDALVTALMNMVYSGERGMMPPSVPADPGNPVLIRPLILLQEDIISEFVAKERWVVDRCRCPWAGDSRREEMTGRLAELTGGSRTKKKNLWDALSASRP